MKRIISLVLLGTILFSAFPIFAETEDLVHVEAGTIFTRDEKEYIVINGVEYDVTGWSAEDIDALRQTNVSGSNTDTANESLNDKYNPKNDINWFFDRGWSREEAGVVDRTPGSVSSEVVEYEGSIRLMIGLGILSRINGKLAGDKAFTVDDFKKAVELLNVYMTKVNPSVEYGEIVTGNDLLNFLTEGLGYGGETPSQLVLRCKSEITKGINFDMNAELTRDTASQMIRAAMGVETIKVHYGIDNLFSTGGETIFEKMDIKGVTGWVNANFETNIFGGDTVRNSKYIEINNAEVLIEDTEYAEYVGRYVDAYIMEDDNDDILISMTDNSNGEKLCFNITPSEIEKVASSAIEYNDEKNKIRKVDVEPSARIIKNGEYVGTFSSKPVDLSKCKQVVLYDIDDDGVYDYVTVVDTVSYLVNKVEGDVIFVNDYLTALDYSETENLSVYIYGTKKSISDIKADNVISVASNSKGDVKIYVANKNDEGNINSLNDDGFVIEGDDTLYEFATDFSDTVTVGEYYQVFFDYQGKVAFAKKTVSGGPTATGRLYAFLIGAKSGIGLGGEDEGYFKIGTVGQQEITWETLTVEGKITFENGADGSTTRKKAGEIAALAELQTPQLIVYETNSRGQLSKIITAQDISNDAEMPIDESKFQLQKKYTGTNKVEMYYQGFFNGDFTWDNKTLAISVPYDMTDTEAYAYIAGSMGHTSWSNVEVYDANVDRNLQGLVIRREESGSTAAFVNPVVIVVAEAKMVYNHTTEETEFVIVGADGKEYWSKDFDKEIGLSSAIPEEASRREQVKKVSEIKVGDILRAEVNAKNKINLFAVEIRLSDFDPNTVPLFFFGTWNNRVATNGMSTGFKHAEVVKNGSSKNAIMVKMQKRDTKGTDDPSDDEIIPDALQLLYADSNVCKMYEYNKSRRTIRKINRGEIVPGDHVVHWSDTWYIKSQLVKIVD